MSVVLCMAVGVSTISDERAASKGAGAARGTLDAAPTGVVAGKSAAGGVQRDAIRTPWRSACLVGFWARTRSGGLGRSNGRDTCRKRPARSDRRWRDRCGDPSLPRTAGRSCGLPWACRWASAPRPRQSAATRGREVVMSEPPRSDRPGCALRGRASRVVAGCARQPSARRAAIAALPAGRLEAAGLAGVGLAERSAGLGRRAWRAAWPA